MAQYRYAAYIVPLPGRAFQVVFPTALTDRQTDRAGARVTPRREPLSASDPPLWRKAVFLQD